MNKLLMNKLYTKPLARAILCGAVLASLQGCVGLMVGGAVASAALHSRVRTRTARAHLDCETRAPASGVMINTRRPRSIRAIAGSSSRSAWPARIRIKPLRQSVWRGSSTSPIGVR